LGILGPVVKWFASFLMNRQLLSSWLYVFIDSLRPSCPTHKYVDDTTLTEILSRNDPSCMDVYLSELRRGQ